tara:strand:- start:3815 stop:5827 length:2013 start_codon:yes stop_codon:yes gene_type:complete
MAEYKRQGTNKYYGAGNAGYVSSGSSVDGLAKSLTNAGYNIGKAESLRIDRKKDSAIAKIDEMYANGKSFETIQAEIIKGDHPELTGKYIEATTNYHAGRVKAHEVINSIKQGKLDNGYDISNESMNLDMFYKQYMPDTKAMDSSTLLGFTSQFNKFRHIDAVQDAELRGAYNSDKKVREGTGLLDDIPTENLKKELPDFIKGLQIPVPNGDGSGKSNLLHTNAETLSIVRRSILDIIANAKTEDDLDRADILMNTNLGYSKSGSAIGTLASRKSKEVIGIQDELTRKRRDLEINDRQEKEYQRNEEVKSITAELYSDVIETNAAGETITRPKNHTEKMALRDRLEAMGDGAAVTNFDKYMKADLYINEDPEILDTFVEKIYTDGFFDVEEMKAEFNKLDTDPRKMGAMLSHFENSQKDDNANLHLNNLAYSSGSKSIMSIIDGAFKDSTMRNKEKAQALAESSVQRHVLREIYDFENDFFKQNGKKPTNDERDAFMVKLEGYIAKQYKNAVGIKQKELTTFDDQRELEETAGFEEVDRQIEKEAQEARDNTVITTGIDGEAITLGGYVDTVLENFDMVEPPKLRKTIIEGIISEDEKYIQQTLPKITKYIESIVGTTLNQEVIDMMSNEDLTTIIQQITTNLKMNSSNDADNRKANNQIAKIIQSIIGK